MFMRWEMCVNVTAERHDDVNVNVLCDGLRLEENEFLFISLFSFVYSFIQNRGEKKAFHAFSPRRQDQANKFPGHPPSSCYCTLGTFQGMLALQRNEE